MTNFLLGFLGGIVFVILGEMAIYIKEWDDFDKRNKTGDLFYATLGCEAFYLKTTKGYPVSAFLNSWKGTL